MHKSVTVSKFKIQVDYGILGAIGQKNQNQFYNLYGTINSRKLKILHNY